MVSKNLVYVKWICASKSKVTFLFKPSPYGCVQKWVWYRWPNILFPIQKHVVLMVYPIAGQSCMGLSFPFLNISHPFGFEKNPHFYADAGPINPWNLYKISMFDVQPFVFLEFKSNPPNMMDKSTISSIKALMEMSGKAFKAALLACDGQDAGFN